MRRKVIGFFYYETNKETSTVICSVVKHLGSGRAHKKCFPLRLEFQALNFFRALPLPACFTTEQSTVEASLSVDYFTDRL